VTQCVFLEITRICGTITVLKILQDNNFSLNVSKTEEMIVNSRKRRAEQASLK
jgi:hypothetical protein